MERSHLSPDTDFEVLKAHFSEEEIIKIMVTVGAINVWNRLVLSLRFHILSKQNESLHKYSVLGSIFKSTLNIIHKTDLCSDVTGLLKIKTSLKTGRFFL
jgi:hypothetical protein